MGILRKDALTPLGKDRDYDHRVDHWATYQDGKAATAEFDTNKEGDVDAVWATPGH